MWMNEWTWPMQKLKCLVDKGQNITTPRSMFLAASHAASEQEGNRDAYILFFIFLLHLILCFALIKKAQ